jgi:hypothetical protein
MRNNRDKRIGEVHTNKLGEQFVIIDYENKARVTIQFLDKYKATSIVDYANVRRGSVKNPYSKTVCGVGMLGLLPNNTKPTTKIEGVHTKEYRVWHSMLCRCYTEQYQKNGHTYIDAEVCERWLCFANFLEDLPKIKGYDEWYNSTQPYEYALDKDILGNNSKYYCLENCCFVTVAENSKERNERLGNPFSKRG